jgi:DNA-directed RNA polymerase specialized sigma24 family protein
VLVGKDLPQKKLGRWEMATSNDVTDLYDRLCAGDARAAYAVWDGFYERLVRVARRKLVGVPRRAFDEEDVALSALRSFLEGAKNGRFYRWQSGKELWQLLLTVTARKAFAYRQRETREKRGGGRVRGDSVFGYDDSHAMSRSLSREVLATEPSPDQLEVLMEEAEELLDALPDETLRNVARWKLAGYTNDEIADSLGCVRRTVERKLERIRCKWLERVPC